jgi:hypothetical protein
MDVRHDFLETLADKSKVGSVSVTPSCSSFQRAPRALLIALMAASAPKAPDIFLVASSIASRVFLDHSMAFKSRAANAPVLARIWADASRDAGV